MQENDIRLEEARTRSVARDRIRAMPPGEREVAVQEEEKRKRLWDLANPVTAHGNLATATATTVNTSRPIITNTSPV
jgi:hypothetical protein